MWITAAAPLAPRASYVRSVCASRAISDCGLQGQRSHHYQSPSNAVPSGLAPPPSAHARQRTRLPRVVASSAVSGQRRLEDRGGSSSSSSSSGSGSRRRVQAAVAAAAAAAGRDARVARGWRVEGGGGARGTWHKAAAHPSSARWRRAPRGWRRRAARWATRRAARPAERASRRARCRGWTRTPRTAAATRTTEGS